MHPIGKIQRRSRLALVGHPDREFRTSELAEWAYPLHEGPIDRKHDGRSSELQSESDAE